MTTSPVESYNKDMKVIRSLEKLGTLFWLVLGFALLCGVGLLDYLTGAELSFSLFYLFPIALVAWFTNPWLGLLAAGASAGVWLTVDLLSGTVYSHPAVYAWNAAIRFGFFGLMLFSIELGKALDREKTLASTDYVTGAANSRFFHALLQREIDRARRYQHPITIAYLDIDTFKAVNDHFGHTTGDRVLAAVVENMQKGLRKTDVVGRLGGDEFAVLLPELGAQAAQVVIAKMQQGLLDEMRENDWPVTFSIGVLTMDDISSSADEVINMADTAMYSVKNSGKNNITYVTYGGEAAPVQAP